jgi:hypothetical protein
VRDPFHAGIALGKMTLFVGSPSWPAVCYQPSLGILGSMSATSIGS